MNGEVSLAPPLTADRLLWLTLRSIRIAWPRLLGLTAVAGAVTLVPPMITVAVVPAVLANSTDFEWAAEPITCCALVLALFPGLVVVPLAAGHLTFHALDDGRPRLGASLAVALRRFLPGAVAMVLSSLVILGGSLLLYVPGFIALAGLVVVPPVVAVEGIGPLASLRRSWRLSQGFKGKIFLLNFGLQLVAYAVIMVTTGVAGSVPGIGLAIQAFGCFLYLALLMMVPVLAGATYHALRVTKEGYVEDGVAEVFD